MMILRKNPAYSLLTLAFFAPLAMGCQTTAVSELDDSTVPMTVSLSNPDGVVETVSGTFADIAGPSLGMLPEFELDGQLSIDAAGLLSGSQAAFDLPEAGQVHLVRSGNTLQRLDEVGSEAATVVQWNDALDTFWIVTPQGEGTLAIEGLADETLRARYIGYMAAIVLGAHQTMMPEDPEVARCASCVVIITLAALGLIGYLACITSGNSNCLAAAELGCGAGNVDAYKVICGAGYDVNGEWRLGYLCTYRCK